MVAFADRDGLDTRQSLGVDCQSLHLFPFAAIAAAWWVMGQSPMRTWPAFPGIPSSARKANMLLDRVPSDSPRCGRRASASRRAGRRYRLGRLFGGRVHARILTIALQLSIHLFRHPQIVTFASFGLPAFPPRHLARSVFRIWSIPPIKMEASAVLWRLGFNLAHTACLVMPSILAASDTVTKWSVFMWGMREG